MEGRGRRPSLHLDQRPSPVTQATEGRGLLAEGKRESLPCFASRFQSFEKPAAGEEPMRGEEAPLQAALLDESIDRGNSDCCNLRATPSTRGIFRARIVYRLGRSV